MCPDQDTANCLIPFHVMTGCDANSGFYGHGKASLFNTLVNSSEARSLLLQCGGDIPIYK